MKRRLWRRVHLVLSLLAAIPLVVAGLTGVLLAYEKPIERWLEPALYPQSGAGEPLPLEAVLASLREAAPQARLNHVGVPREPAGDHYVVYASEAGEQGVDRYMLYVDPYSGAVHRRDGTSVMKWIEKIHRNLLLGQTGRYLVAGASILFLVLSAVGFYLWWPMRGSTMRRLMRRRDALSWHNVTGLLTLPVLVVIAFTGITLTFHSSMISAINTLTLSPPLPEPPRIEPVERGVGLPAVVRAVQREYPEHRISGFGERRGPDWPYMVRIRHPQDAHPAGWQRVFVHPASGELMGEIDAYRYSWGAAYQQSWWAWHTGQMLGGIGTLVWSLSSAVLALLLVTGVMLWLRRHGPRSA